MRVYVAAEPADLRKSFDGLSSLVAERFGADPLCGHLFVFRNRRGDQIRVSFWDRTGYAIFAKRLERGTFRAPRAVTPGATSVVIDAAELAKILEGIALAPSKLWREVRLAEAAPPPAV
ncbi:IS66 family insertion sequence element accessory protein TnpB [Sorangium cellulosum]|uniref:IS66 family insertion sequence element accessory protein TnpB n=1 Tax=Sorangium cellulosum TaxID=56 RepID=UPI0016516130|nr:IS66 family insertion sequence element accessory protein TnpB [Sorangium cellulosum]